MNSTSSLSAMRPALWKQQHRKNTVQYTVFYYNQGKRQYLRKYNTACLALCYNDRESDNYYRVIQSSWQNEKLFSKFFSSSSFLLTLYNSLWQLAHTSGSLLWLPPSRRFPMASPWFWISYGSPLALDFP